MPELEARAVNDVDRADITIRLGQDTYKFRVAKHPHSKGLMLYLSDSEATKLYFSLVSNDTVLLRPLSVATETQEATP